MDLLTKMKTPQKLTETILTDGDREFALRHDLTDEDMIAYIEDIDIDATERAEQCQRESRLVAAEWAQEQEAKWQYKKNLDDN